MLEIGEHYNQFRRLRSLKEIEEIDDKIPYMSAIKELRKLSSTVTPGAGYELILVFQQKIRACYNNYFKNCLRVGDMDDYLPITIFCVLAADCEDNLLARVKLLLADLDGVYESEWEKKTLTDIEAAFDYILDQWHLAK